MTDAKPVPHLLTLLDELPGGLALFDTNGVLQEAKEAFRRALGDTGGRPI